MRKKMLLQRFLYPRWMERVLCSYYPGRKSTFKSNFWDNAMAENFFWHYKCECIRLRKKSVHSFEKFVEVMEEYLNFYNKEPYQRRLKNMSLINYRLENFKN